MGNALALLPTIEFAQQKTLVPELDRLFKTLTAEQKEFWDDVAKPKASRRADAAEGIYRHHRRAADDTRQAVGSARRRRQPSGRDDRPVARDQADRLAAAQHRRRGLADDFERARRRPHDAGNPADLYKIVGGTEIAWNALELAASGMQLPPALSAAMAATKTAYFDPQYLALRDRLLNAADRRREARNDRQPMEPDHGRPPRLARSPSPKPRSRPPRTTPPSSTPRPCARW